MNQTSTAPALPPCTNGVDVGQLTRVIDAVQRDPAYGQFQFRVGNDWQDGGLNRSRMQAFYAGGREDDGREQAFYLDADEPAILASGDTAPTPVEYVLHALAGCLTTTLVYHAAVRGIEIEAIHSELTGDIDVRGLFGLDETVRKGFNQVRVHLRVKSAASAAELKELAMYSAVYEMVSGSLPVAVTLETY
jgi:uncharacterized OsmC-like protein